jgi:hypothetical protein
MTGLLKARKPVTQFLLLISIAVFSLFIVGFIGTFILSAITGVNFSTLADTDKWNPNSATTLTLIRGMQVVQFISLFVLPAYICSKLFSTHPSSYLGMKKPSRNHYFLVGALLMVLAIPFAEYLGLLNRNIPFPDSWASWMKDAEADAEKTIKILLSKHTAKDLFLNIVFIAGLAALGEELLFRGMAQRLLIKMFKNPWAGIIIAAAIFSAIHMQFYGFLPRFALGVLLGAIYWYSGSLWVAIAAHFVYDALLLILVFFNPEMEANSETVKMNNIALLAAISFILVVAGIWWMQQRSSTRYQQVYADDDIPVKDHPFDLE